MLAHSQGEPTRKVMALARLAIHPLELRLQGMQRADFGCQNPFSEPLGTKVLGLSLRSLFTGYFAQNGQPLFVVSSCSKGTQPPEISCVAESQLRNLGLGNQAQKNLHGFEGNRRVGLCSLREPPKLPGGFPLKQASQEDTPLVSRTCCHQPLVPSLVSAITWDPLTDLHLVRARDPFEATSGN